MTGSAHGTISSLRAPQRALLVGPKDANLPQRQQRLMEEAFLPFPLEDAAAALKKLRAEKFALVLLSAETQGMSAAEFLTALRADEKLGKLPVIALSATDDTAAVEAVMAAGADAWIPAVVDADTLKARLAEALERRK